MIELNQQTSVANYFFFARIWRRLRIAFGTSGDQQYALHEGNREVNLMGIRGMACLAATATDGRQARWATLAQDKTGVLDDTMLILYREGTENPTSHVRAFAASLQYGYRTTDLPLSRDLRPGMHKYRLGRHRKSHSTNHPLAVKKTTDQKPEPPKVEWANNDSAMLPAHKNTNYRALMPHEMAQSYRDADMNGRLNSPDPITQTETVTNKKTGKTTTTTKNLEEAGHNIHAGNTNATSSGGTGSEGCQVISGWDSFLEFMRCVESDHSILGVKEDNYSDGNQLPAIKNGSSLNIPSENGTRPVIYSLIDTNFLFPCSLPTGPSEPDRRLSLASDEEAKARLNGIMTQVERGSNGGCFPVGQNHCWHAGLHLPLPTINQTIHSPMPGEIVAFRLGTGGKGKATATIDGWAKPIELGNHNFILVRHTLKDGATCLVKGESYYGPDHYPVPRETVFYSLYMHLGERSVMTEAEITHQDFPFKWLRDSYEVTNSFTTYRSARLDDTVRPNRGNIETENRANQVILNRGDKFRLITQAFLWQEIQSWSLIEKYFDATTRQAIDPPQRLYTKDSLVRQKAKSIAEWRTGNFLNNLKNGDIILAENAFGHPVRVDEGDPLWSSGLGLTPNGDLGSFLHWSIFSTENLFPSWRLIQDDTDDTVIEDDGLLRMIESAPDSLDKQNWSEKVHSFFHSDREETKKQIESLRGYVLHGQSEWVEPHGEHIPKLKKLSEREGKTLDEEQYRKCSAPFKWWPNVCRELKLPENGRVFHYNPARFLMAVACLDET